MIMDPGNTPSSVPPPPAVPPLPPPAYIPGSPPIAGRPVAVTIFAVFLFVAALFELSGILTSLKKEGVLQVIDVSDSITFGILAIVLGISLLKLAPWARIWTLAVVWIRFVTQVILIPIYFSHEISIRNVRHEDEVIALVIIIAFAVIALSITIFATIVMSSPTTKAAFANHGKNS